MDQTGSTAGSTHPPEFAPPNEFERFAEARRLSANGLLWQVPGLSLAAQSFLIGAASNNDVDEPLRIAVSALAIAIALATIQLLMRHRYRELCFSLALDASRVARNVTPFDHPNDLFESLAARRDGSSPDIHSAWAGRPLLRLGMWPAWKTWMILFGCFIALDLVVMASAVL